jgi:DNA-binding GntR family transcriptional regulator
MDQNLRERVVQQVRAEIVSGQSGPGKMYSVPSLAADLGVSTTPVREALLELTRIGLIEPMRNRGFKVVEPSAEELRNLFEMRELLEVRAAERLAQLPRKARSLAGLTALADAVAAAVEKDEVFGYLEADRRFHHAFIAAAQNPLLTEFAMGLRDKMRLHGISSRAGLERQAASVAEHYRLIELAKAGDVAAIAPLISQHILSWEPIYLSAMQKLPRDLSHGRA